MKKILAFESSCDDTAVAIIDELGHILANKIYSQLSEYQLYGGVVPEIGSRAHIEQILGLTKLAFSQADLSPSDIDVVAATFAPGLIGPLLVGAHFAKAFACARNLPLIAVHHIVGHVLAGYSEADFPEPPFLALIVSGGHTALYQCKADFSIKLVGETLDDAAGEAFDKIGRALGLGYPAGKKIDDLARLGDASRWFFPIAMRHEEHFNFSFSGLKTKALECIKNQSPLDDKSLHDICAAVEDAIAKALVERSMKALAHLGLKKLVLGGGVAANSHLRDMLSRSCEQASIQFYMPNKSLCTDNAVMIARAALIKLKNSQFAPTDLDVKANLSVEMATAL